MTGLVTLTILIFFFNDTATTEIYTLSLHDALPILPVCVPGGLGPHKWADRRLLDALGEAIRGGASGAEGAGAARAVSDRKSTRLNSSHANISYAVFCLKKKKLDSELPPPSLSKKHT